MKVNFGSNQIQKMLFIYLYKTNYSSVVYYINLDFGTLWLEKVRVIHIIPSFKKNLLVTNYFNELIVFVKYKIPSKTKSN